MLGALAHGLVNVFDQLAKKLVVGDAQATLGVAGGLAVLVVDVNQVDVAGDIEFSSAEFAHAHDPALGRHIARHGRAVQRREFGHGQLVGQVQGQLGQLGHGVGDVYQRRALLAVEHRQTFQNQVPQHTQCRRSTQARGFQFRQAQIHLRLAWHAGGQEVQDIGIASTNTGHKARMFGRRAQKIGCAEAVGREGRHNLQLQGNPCQSSKPRCLELPRTHRSSPASLGACWAWWRWRSWCSGLRCNFGLCRESASGAARRKVWPPRRWDYQ